MIILYLVIGCGYSLNLASIFLLIRDNFTPYKRLRLLTLISTIVPYLTLIIATAYIVYNIYLDSKEWIEKGHNYNG